MVATEEAVAAAAEADKKAPSRVETACLTRTSTSPALDQAEQEDDEGYSRSPQNVAEYVQDIYGLLGRHEGHHLPRHNYMDSQADLNPKMRAILVDWLVEVHMKYKLRLETLFLTVNLIDRSLDQRQTMRQKLQLVGVAAMLIASKFEEINPPEISDFVYITDNAYTKEDILQMEVVILTDLV
jgi:cyclin B